MKKVLKNLKANEWLKHGHMSNFFMVRGCVCHIGKQLLKEKNLRTCLVSEFKLTFSHFKQHYLHFHTLFYPHIFQKTINNNSQTTLPNIPLDFWFLLVLGTRRRKETPKKQKRNERRRTEKKENLENAEERVKIRFVLFISFLLCGLSVFWDCIFGFVVKMRDKKTKFNRENGTTLLLFLIFSSFGLTRETLPRFSNPSSLTAVRIVHCVFCVWWVLRLKELSQGMVLG